MAEFNPQVEGERAGDLLEALKVVTDPEIGISIVDLGLIYSVEVGQKSCLIKMTLTSQACPVGPQMLQSVQRVVEGFLDLKADQVKVELVWSPLWNPQVHATEDGKFMLGIT